MKKKNRSLVRDNIGFWFVLPAFVYMAVFVGYPILSNILLSFQEVTLRTLTASQRPFAGLQNYISIFQDKVFIKSLGNTFLFTVSCLVIQFVIGFGLAVFFNQNFRIARFIRGILMMPWMIPITVTALMFKFIFGTDVGILNHLLSSLGLIQDHIDWLTSTGTAMAAIVIANIWIGIPFNMILISTGLTTIPRELYESASIDGAGKIHSFLKITLPLLKPTINSVLILGFIYTFKVFDLVYVMTSGGPVNSTHMLSTYSYKLSFEMFKYSKGAAAANVLFVILLAISVFYLRITAKEET